MRFFYETLIKKFGGKIQGKKTNDQESLGKNMAFTFNDDQRCTFACFFLLSSLFQIFLASLRANFMIFFN